MAGRLTPAPPPDGPPDGEEPRSPDPDDHPTIEPAAGPAAGPSATPTAGHRALRLPGGEPHPRRPPVSVRRTVGLSEDPVVLPWLSRVLRATVWTACALVIAGGSLALYEMLFTDDGSLSGLLDSSTQPPPAVQPAEPGEPSGRPITNADPDLPVKTDMLVPPTVDPSAPADGSATTGPGSGDHDYSRGEHDYGSGDGDHDYGSGSHDDGSGSDGDSSGPGSGGG